MLTAVQQQLFDFLRQAMEAGEPMPTYREIGSKFGWSSTGTVRDHLQALARKGYVELSNGRSRALSLKLDLPATAKVQILGRIVAGTPVESEQTCEAHIPVPSEWVRHGKCFAVRVSGDSMRDAAILDGDIVIARAQAVASAGDIVVATLDGETTLKRLTKRGTHWFLTPENKCFRPISIETDSTVIRGVMVGLLRRRMSA